MPNKFTTLFVGCNPYACQFGQYDFFEYERFIIEYWIQCIVSYASCTKLFPHGVGGQSEHVDFHVDANFFIAQKLARQHGNRYGAGDYAIDLRMARNDKREGERIKCSRYSNQIIKLHRDFPLNFVYNSLEFEFIPFAYHTFSKWI